MDKANECQPNSYLIDVHHHVMLPAYEKALVRSGAGNPSRPLRKGDPAQIVYEKMLDLGIDTAILRSGDRDKD